MICINCGDYGHQDLVRVNRSDIAVVKIPKITLVDCLSSNPNPKECKLALAVKMRLEGIKHKKDSIHAEGSSSYVSCWRV